MNDKFEMGTGQAHELAMAFGRNDWTNEEIKALCKGSVLADVRRVIRGHAAITTPDHAIDCDADPFLPQGWKVEEHTKGGHFQWDASKVELFLSSSQQNGKVVEGNKLRKELAKKPCFNANVLDYLLANPHLIPEEWKGKAVFFWGTVYRSSDGDLYVRCLCWRGDGWRWGYGWLGSDWNVGSPAALRAS